MTSECEKGKGRSVMDKSGRTTKCVHCGRNVRVFDGEWHHYWWVKDLTATGERRLRGSRTCAWVDAPADVPTVAAPAAPAESSV